MSDKKHIDRLFQEKLKDFEVAPDDAVWNTIHYRLHKDKPTRKVIPMWWKIAGVAALLALLFTVGIQLVSNDFDSNNTNTVDTEKQPSNESNNRSAQPLNNSSEIQNQIDNASEVVSENDMNSENASNTVSEETSNDNIQKQRANQNVTINSEKIQNRIVSSDESNSSQKTSLDKLDKNRSNDIVDQENKTNASKDAIATISQNNDKDSNNNGSVVNNGQSETDKLIKDSKNNSDANVTDASEKMEDILTEDKKEESIEDAIAQANTDDEKEKEKEKKLNRWNISPNVAPVYFNSLGKGSSLDKQFVNNTKEGDVTMSYGVGGSYAINDRLKVRTGINKVDLGYRTENVIAFRSIGFMSQSTAAHTTISNIDMSQNAENMTYLSSESLNKNITPEIMNTKTQGTIDQRFGFIEVPLEVEYALVDKKIAVNVIGGFSTLVVDKNEVYSVVNGVETKIGEANNINNMSYSANFGLGINYNFSERIKVNVEPTFKYQINTFNNSSGDFQPYFIGIYTGLSYKF
ncbi:MAG TPA: hypothetical protein VKZ98_05015 [Aquaticitalea sp.]|nr:hypothetical protein [Aquaticitalea sp.]